MSPRCDDDRRDRGRSPPIRATTLADFQADPSVDGCDLDAAEFERRVAQALSLARDFDTVAEVRTKIAEEVVTKGPTRPWVIAALNRRLDELEGYTREAEVRRKDGDSNGDTSPDQPDRGAAATDGSDRS